MLPSANVALGGAEQASAPKMDWQMQHLCYTYDNVWERQPPPHTRSTKPTYVLIDSHTAWLKQWLLSGDRTYGEK